MTDHIGPAWILSGIANTPGVLELSDGRLSFTGDDGVVFDEPLEAVTGVKFPWYQFSGGFTATIAGTRHRISLTRPNGAPDPSGPDLASATGSIGDVASGRREGKTWRSLLVEGAGAPRPS
ncbi:hypothetical protein [Pseudonocardia sp. KRD291]|uniref:hypothetical protein n=1 Tax=Pseudonocardia sp. KRD291 TaxID=2792007 RepID=UPI001C49EC1A|nr:hypothetical protein [Pseudonocardia sp. KRD291]MBW0101198.1 hypothetical protein [Pseudonocardia sp. KRD291]